MISFLRGTLITKAPASPKGAYFVVDVHGVGFEVFTSQRSVLSAGTEGSEVLIHTFLVVREDAMTLVGFNSREERDLFSILQGASGVGLKVALALLDTLSVSEVAQAVVSGEHKLLTAAKGVGPKLAQRIVLDLKEKMTTWRQSAIQQADLESTKSGLTVPQTDAFTEAETVLLSLGYTPLEVQKSLAAISGQQADATTSENILRDSLQWLAQTL
ncbi:MAG: Holliday junction branch migration protein RuvA [Vampirovibrio sp.]|nr:Holliday junction branch migration protein RuvA [Vampirovibrio sp.]